MFTPVELPGPHDTQHGPDASAVENQGVGSHPRELGTSGHRITAAVVFWQDLNPVERDAFRLFALPRTFAAGARLVREGDEADHVIVILSGKTKICVQEGGRERILAVRGPGQLVGERAALQISVRSASVIALETVQALVAPTRDFAAFITNHPRVLAIVERQVYDRLTEDSAAYELGAVSNIPVDHAATADRFGHSLSTERPAQQPRLLNGENCTIMLSDVVGFGANSRTDEDRRIIREALFSMTHTVLRDLPDAWSWDDRGDGLLTVVLPSVPTAKVVAHLHKELPAALEEHNRVYPESARIQLRVAINVGPVASDVVGVSGEAIIVSARLVEAPVFKQAMSESGASLGIVASTFIYESVIRHGPYLEGYSEIPVEVKESSVLAWMKLFDRPLSSSAEGA
jgi:CRP-like cAMP-binding protein